MTLSKLGERRITRLIDFMAKQPRAAAKHFDMGKWFVHDSSDHDHGKKNGQEVTKTDYHLCGTTACAMGYAAQMPYFRRLGVKLVWSIGPDWSGADLIIGDENCGLPYSDSIRNLFDIDAERADILFGVYNKDKSPRGWAKRARDLLRKWKAHD